MLSAQQIESYNRDGFVRGGRLLSNGQVDELRAELDRLIAQYDKVQSDQVYIDDTAAFCQTRDCFLQFTNLWELSEPFRRVTRDPELTGTLSQLLGAPRIRIFADKKSGKNIDREELWKALDHLRPGDTLVVPSLDRLGRSLQDLIAIVASIARLLGVSRATIDKYVPELKTDQRPQLEPGPQTTRAELPAG